MADDTRARRMWMGIAGIVALGVVVGIANNLLAKGTRRLDWVGSYPPKGEPNCLKVLPAGATGASGTDVAVAPIATTPPAGETAPAAIIATGEVGASGETGATGTTGESGATGEPVPATAPSGAEGPAGGAAPPPAATVEIPEVPFGKQWLELAPEQVKALYDRSAQFVDARRTSQYEEGHIKGAISIPVWESGVDEKVAQVMFAPNVMGNPNTPIVVYCNGGDCEDSHMLGAKLQEGGHVAVYVYKDGWPNWLDHAWPSSTGSAP